MKKQFFDDDDERVRPIVKKFYSRPMVKKKVVLGLTFHT